MGEAAVPATKGMTPREFYEHIGSPRWVCAPMVNASELPFRMLCRRYGADLCYTPMLHSRLFTEDPGYRASMFTTCPEDRPLFVQFCGNDPKTLLEAAKYVEDCCDAVDLNLGCPQGIARRGHYGSFLLEEWDLLREIVSEMSAKLEIPVTCKIRLLPKVEDTIQLCRVLIDAGCKLISIHGRTREEKKDKVGRCRWEEIAEVRAAFPEFPIFANGGVETFADLGPCLATTRADGVMSSEALLENPALFANNQRTLSTAAASAFAESQDAAYGRGPGGDARFEPKICGKCGKTGVMSRVCTKCDQVYYCSKKCAASHWKSTHRDGCSRQAAKAKKRKRRADAEDEANLDAPGSAPTVEAEDRRRAKRAKKAAFLELATQLRLPERPSPGRVSQGVRVAPPGSAQGDAGKAKGAGAGVASEHPSPATPPAPTVLGVTDAAGAHAGCDSSDASWRDSVLAADLWETVRVSQDDLAEEYLQAVDAFPGASSTMIKGHLFSMCFAGLARYPDLRAKMGAARSLEQYQQVLGELRERRRAEVAMDTAHETAWYRRHRRGKGSNGVEAAESKTMADAAPGADMEAKDAAVVGGEGRAAGCEPETEHPSREAAAA